MSSQGSKDIEGEGASVSSSAQKPSYDFSKPMPAEHYATRALESRTNPSQTNFSDVASRTTSFVQPRLGAPKLDAEYYEQWRREKAAAVARGEDPYAEFAAKAKERHESSTLGKLGGFFKKFGKGILVGMLGQSFPSGPYYNWDSSQSAQIFQAAPGSVPSCFGDDTTGPEGTNQASCSQARI